MSIRKNGQVGPRFIVYLVGLLVMALGIVLIIKADLGASPWDVLHVGLYYQFGFSIGTWSIFVGFIILGCSALLAKQFPQIGAFLNMVLVGLFIDMYYLLPFIQTPGGLLGKSIMFVMGLILYGYGMGIYISARFGAGPRDSLMIAITERTKWKVQHVRACMEILVLIIGWQLGGPVFWGTILISLTVGPLAGMCLPQCQRITDLWLQKLRSKKNIVEQSDTKRGASL